MHKYMKTRVKFNYESLNHDDVLPRLNKAIE